MKDQTTGQPRTVPGITAPAAPDGIGGAALVPTLLLADADEDACAMLRDALLEGTGPCRLRTVTSAQQLADHLANHNGHEDARTSPLPALIVIDADLPGNEDLGAVRAIKSDPDLRSIPVVLLARHPEPATVEKAYDAGVNTVIPKPVTFLALVKLIKVFTAYWLEAAALPPRA
jgi:CheY-like chemotaxis protein